jgi:hypothetical protein
MTRLERRCCEVLLGSIIPAGKRHPGVARISLELFWPEFERTAPPLLRFGLRASTWLLTLAPLWLLLGFALFPALPADRRDACLRRVASSRWYLVRQMLETLKIVACLAYFTDAGVRGGFEGAG